MNERTWLLGDAEHPHDDRPDRAVENNLWTRRSALALTAGFLAVGAAPARAAFVQTPRAARQPHRGLQVEPGAGADDRRGRR